MAATPEDPADPAEPFSPSIFLDLPPTPHPVGDGEDPGSWDDQVLPFIRRMLMEEDTDEDILSQYPDQPAAVLQAAEQPFAQILSGSATTIDGTFSLSPAASADVPAFAGATWPYDPDELSQRLLSSSAGQGRQLLRSVGEASAALFNGSGAGAASIQSSCCFQPHVDGTAEEGRGTRHTTTTVAAAGDGVTMDMLNLAFLKGMEEANKFLPTTNSNSSLPSGGKLLYDYGSKQRAVDGRCRAGKNTHRWDHGDLLEAEAGRRSKLMAPEQDGTGEVADSVFLKGCEVALEKMHGLSISSSSSSAPVPPSGSGEERTRSSGSSEAVELRSLLIHCAEAVSIGNRLRATELLRQINQRSSPRGDASQRLAHCFAQGLELRLSGPHEAHSNKSMLVTVDLLRAYQLHLQVCSFRMVAFMFSQMAIISAVAGRKKVHIVDYGENHGFQWPLLLDVWATREGGPPDVRITGIGFPQPGFRPAARIQETGRRLTDFARQRGVPFSFRGVVSASWETVSAEDLDIEPDEVLVINGLFHFGKLRDDGIDIDSPSPRDMVLGNISKMRPDVFILCDENSSHSVPFFVTRFREALFYYSAMFDMMDATAPRGCAERMLVERVFGHWAMDAIACEGSDRVQRPEAYKQWQVRNTRVGLRQLPLNPDTVKYLRKMVKDGYHKDFVIDVDQHWLLQGWKGRILCAMSTWVADDNDDVVQSRQS
ncbi:hypothetical protein U9M48_002430 [Paspalum notatum var. saurae]|uniref:Scarecrow-like protein 9 n=1 Tax=Paspalum notatum var. saurae TaxID=547442 RepID=A0AAQ3SJT2_PASNO